MRLDMENLTLYFGDVLSIICEDLNITEINNCHIAINNLEYLKNIDYVLKDCTVYVFDNKISSVDFKDIKLEGESNLFFSDSVSIYNSKREFFKEEALFNSILLAGEDLYHSIITNYVNKEIMFYTPIEILNKPHLIKVEPPITLMPKIEEK